MRFKLISSAMLSGLFTLGLACSGAEDAAELTDDSANDGEAEAEEGGGDTDSGATEDGGEDSAEPADTAATAPEPAAAAAPAVEPPAPMPAEPAAAASGPFQGEKLIRYVTAYALNVRAEPSKEAKVVRHVKHGDKVEVVINGEWAQISPGQYISVNRLAETPPAPKKWMKAGGTKKDSGAAHKKSKAKSSP